MTLSTTLRCGSVLKNIKNEYVQGPGKTYCDFWKSNIPLINLVVDSGDMIEVSNIQVFKKSESFFTKYEQFLSIFYCF